MLADRDDTYLVVKEMLELYGLHNSTGLSSNPDILCQALEIIAKNCNSAL